MPAARKLLAPLCPKLESCFLMRQDSSFEQLLEDQTLGGAERDRTVDPLLAKQVLSQLSYSPVISKWWAWVDSNYRPHPYQGCALTN